MLRPTLLWQALLKTWRLSRGKTLTRAGYEPTGGLDGAVATTAEQVHDRFTEGQSTATRRALLRGSVPAPPGVQGVPRVGLRETECRSR
ncbi:hypothetical protein AB0E85_27045 [Streptomyces sp. NPDC029044]|uniref:nSTAND1 domain-containing NTPase n=1 Tax=Streptomyces sp. NPDC029044 TaxID=3157198 RepID=UPI00340FB3C9